MNFKELGIRITDLTLGRKINGTVAAVMLDEVSPDEVKFTRYIVETDKSGFVDLRIVTNTGVNFGILPATPIETPRLSKGDKISIRSSNVTPWVDGSR